MHDELFMRIQRSRFRSKFDLSERDVAYIHQKGMDVVEQHARDFIEKNLAPAYIPNDGKQTPMRGHPVFPARHATACCCRGCLKKWHGIEPGRRLTKDEEDYVVGVIMEWIRRKLPDGEARAARCSVEEEMFRGGRSLGQRTGESCGHKASGEEGPGKFGGGIISGKKRSGTEMQENKEKEEGYYEQLTLPFI